MSRTSFLALGRDTLIYGLGVVLARGVSFIMLPVYTRVLSPADYGILQYLDLSVEIASVLFTACLTVGIQRFYYKAETERGRRAVIASAYILEMGLGAIGAICLALAAPLIWHYGLKEAGSVLLVRIAALNFFLGLLSSLPLSLLRLRQQARLYVIVSFMKLVLQLSLNIWLVVGLRMGPLGILLSGTVANLIIGGGMSVWTLRTWGFEPSREAIRDIRRFGVPYQLSWAANFMATFADQFILQALRGPAALGVYSLAFNFTQLHTQLGSIPFMTAWNPIRHQLALEPEGGTSPRFDRGLLYYSIVHVSVAVGIMCLIRPVVTLMTTAPFHVVGRIVPLLLIGAILKESCEAVKFGIDVAEQTKYYTMAMWVSLVPSLGLSLLLVPKFGAHGAAVASVVGCSVRLALCYHFSQRLWPVAYRLTRPLAMLGLAGLVAATVNLTPSEPWPVEFAAGIVLFLAYAVTLWMVILRASDRSSLRTLILARWHRIMSPQRPVNAGAD